MLIFSAAGYLFSAEIMMQSPHKIAIAFLNISNWSYEKEQ